MKDICQIPPCLLFPKLKFLSIVTHCSVFPDPFSYWDTWYRDHSCSSLWEVFWLFLWVPKEHLCSQCDQLPFLVQLTLLAAPLPAAWACARHSVAFSTISGALEPKKIIFLWQRGKTTPIPIWFDYLSQVPRMCCLDPKGPQVLKILWNCCLIVLLPILLHRNQVWIWRGGIAWIRS